MIISRIILCETSVLFGNTTINVDETQFFPDFYHGGAK